jgi:hypothetical protein
MLFFEPAKIEIYWQITNGQIKRIPIISLFGIIRDNLRGYVMSDCGFRNVGFGRRMKQNIGI